MMFYEILVLAVFIFHIGFSQLVVNVKNHGGEIYKESIHANTSLDSITLDFQKTDGTTITQFIDYKNVRV
jgi:hypothetical protein